MSWTHFMLSRFSVFHPLAFSAKRLKFFLRRIRWGKVAAFIRLSAELTCESHNFLVAWTPTAFGSAWNHEDWGRSWSKSHSNEIVTTFSTYLPSSPRGTFRQHQGLRNILILHTCFWGREIVNKQNVNIQQWRRSLWCAVRYVWWILDREKFFWVQFKLGECVKVDIYMKFLQNYFPAVEKWLTIIDGDFSCPPPSKLQPPCTVRHFLLLA